MPQDLQVPFREKDQAKALGARFDFNRKVWYVPDGIDLAPFSRWLPAGAAPPAPTPPAATHGPAAFEPELPYAPAAGAASAGAPATSAPAPGVPALASAPGETLSAVLRRVAAAVSGEFRAPLWVRAEIGDLKLWGDGGRQRAYLELIETGPDGRQIARCRAVIWEQQLPALARKFRETTQSELGPGLKVLLQAAVEFDGRSGLSLIVRDIDPAFTLGDVAARLAQIRESLKKQRLYDLNRRHRLPEEFCRIAVITPRDAAGLGDFRRDIRALEAHGVLRVLYFEAVFQGPNTSASLCAALAQAVEAHAADAFDALVLLRGGGAVTDLAWLNDQAVAEAICRAPLPVITGIGHERDETILDEVAARSFDTPSKISQFIRQTIADNVRAARGNLQTILALAGQHVALARANLRRQRETLRAESAREHREAATGVERLHAQMLPAARDQAQRTRRELGDAMLRLERAARATVAERGAELHGLVHAVRSQAGRAPLLAREQIGHLRAGVADLAARQTHLTQAQIDNARARIAELALRQAELARTQVQALGREVAGLGPETTLGRGFALVRDARGAVVRSRAGLGAGTPLTLQFQDGTVSVRVSDDD